MEELEEFLRNLGIKDEGIQAIVETFPSGFQRWIVRKNVNRLLTTERDAKEAVRLAWMWGHQVELVRMRPVGKEPMEKDFLKL